MIYGFEYEGHDRMMYDLERAPNSEPLLRYGHGVSMFFTNFLQMQTRSDHEVFCDISSRISKLVEIFT